MNGLFSLMDSAAPPPMRTEGGVQAGSAQLRSTRTHTNVSVVFLTPGEPSSIQSESPCEAGGLD